MGTIRRKRTDNEGVSHVDLIPNSFYSPAGGIRLLSPQHWSQDVAKSTNAKVPPSCVTTDKDVTLIWGEGKFRKTIPLGENDNVATMNSPPDTKNSTLFVLKLTTTVMTMPIQLTSTSSPPSDTWTHTISTPQRNG